MIQIVIFQRCVEGVNPHQCNGFSAGVNPDDFRGPGFQSGYDPVWVDLLAKHAEQPFHVLVGGGDQLYCDGCVVHLHLQFCFCKLKFGNCFRVAREPELQGWVKHQSKKEKMKYRLKQDMLDAIDRFYFNHYCQCFRSGAFARANSSMYVRLDLYLADSELIMRVVFKPYVEHAR